MTLLRGTRPTKRRPGYSGARSGVIVVATAATASGGHQVEQDTFRTARVVETGGATVAYRQVGGGPAVVFLHGFPLSGLTWRNVVPALSERFTCYALDLVGLGGTTSPRARDFSSEGQARVLGEALTALGVSQFALVGNDTGGWVARELALLSPGRVTRLALTNTEMPGHRPP